MRKQKRLLLLYIVAFLCGCALPTTVNQGFNHKLLGTWGGRWDNAWTVFFVIKPSTTLGVVDVVVKWQEFKGGEFSIQTGEAVIKDLNTIEAGRTRITLDSQNEFQAIAQGYFPEPRKASLRRLPDTDINNVNDAYLNRWSNWLRFPEQQFSAVEPPADWKIIEPKPQGAVVAWRNSVTKSLIGVTASRIQPAVSLRTAVETFKTGMTKGIRDDIVRSFPGAENLQGKITVAIEDERDMSFDGNTFHSIILNYEATPVEGASLSGKIIFYFLKAEAFIYTLSLNTVRGNYEKDLPMVEQMAQSFTVLK